MSLPYSNNKIRTAQVWNSDGQEFVKQNFIDLTQFVNADWIVNADGSGFPAPFFIRAYPQLDGTMRIFGKMHFTLGTTPTLAAVLENIPDSVIPFDKLDQIEQIAALETVGTIQTVILDYNSSLANGLQVRSLPGNTIAQNAVLSINFILTPTI